MQILFSALPGAIPAAPLGTNKNASVWGTAAATAQIHQPAGLRWRTLLPAAAFAFVGSIAGAAPWSSSW